MRLGGLFFGKHSRGYITTPTSGGKLRGPGPKREPAECDQPPAICGFLLSRLGKSGSQPNPSRTTRVSWSETCLQLSLCIRLFPFFIRSPASEIALLHPFVMPGLYRHVFCRYGQFWQPSSQPFYVLARRAGNST